MSRSHKVDVFQWLHNSHIPIQCQGTQVHFRGVHKEPPYKIHPGPIGLGPVAATSDVTEEQWRNSGRPNAEICHRKWNDQCVGFGAKPTLTAHKKYGETISSYRQNGQNPTKNLKPSSHSIFGSSALGGRSSLYLWKKPVGLFYKHLVTFAPAFAPYMWRTWYIWYVNFWSLSWL